MNPSQLSMIENNKRMIRLDDFIKALNYLDCEMTILKNGEDYMKKMNNDVVKKELCLREVGYSKDFNTLKDKKIMVWFNTFDNKVYVARDMYNEKEYISNEKFDYYEQECNEDKNTSEFGYGEFYQNYMEEDYLWELILKLDDNKNITIEDIVDTLFDKDTI